MNAYLAADRSRPSELEAPAPRGRALHGRGQPRLVADDGLGSGRQRHRRDPPGGLRRKGRRRARGRDLPGRSPDADDPGGVRNRTQEPRPNPSRARTRAAASGGVGWKGLERGLRSPRRPGLDGRRARKQLLGPGGGSRTTTGKPLLANDPHLGCTRRRSGISVRLEAPGYSVAGATLPGLPGVLIGHNARIGWGLTSVEPDVQDLYLEDADPGDPSRYRFGGRVAQLREPPGDDPRAGRSVRNLECPLLGSRPDRDGRPARGPGPPAPGGAALDRPGGRQHDRGGLPRDLSRRQLGRVPGRGEPSSVPGSEHRLRRRGRAHRVHDDGRDPRAAPRPTACCRSRAPAKTSGRERSRSKSCRASSTRREASS